MTQATMAAAMLLHSARMAAAIMQIIVSMVGSICLAALYNIAHDLLSRWHDAG